MPQRLRPRIRRRALFPDRRKTLPSSSGCLPKYIRPRPRLCNKRHHLPRAPKSFILAREPSGWRAELPPPCTLQHCAVWFRLCCIVPLLRGVHCTVSRCPVTMHLAQCRPTVTMHLARITNVSLCNSVCEMLCVVLSCFVLRRLSRPGL